MYGKQILVGSLGLGLAFVLFFFTDSSRPQPNYFDREVEILKSDLSESGRGAITHLEGELKKDPSVENVPVYGELATQWADLGQAQISAYYLYKSAVTAPSVESWNRAGNELLTQLPAAEEDDEKVNLAFYAIFCFDESLKLDPDQTDIEINKARSYIEGTSRFMDGILMLRAIAERKPDNLEANFLLGRFSMMSGQYEKAIQRMQIVLEKDSLNLQARYMLAESLMATGQKELALKTLQDGLRLHADDEQVQSELTVAITQLKE